MTDCPNGKTRREPSARRWLWCGVGVALAVAPVGAQPAPLNLTLKLDRGGEVSGDVLEATSDLIVLNLSGRGDKDLDILGGTV